MENKKFITEEEFYDSKHWFDNVWDFLKSLYCRRYKFIGNELDLLNVGFRENGNKSVFYKTCFYYNDYYNPSQITLVLVVVIDKETFNIKVLEYNENGLEMLTNYSVKYIYDLLGEDLVIKI